MKILLKKIKKCNKLQKVLFFSSIILYAIFFIIFTINILKLKGIETGLRITLIILFILWFLLYFLGGIVSMILKKKKFFSLLTIINTFIIIIFIVLSIFISYIIKSLDIMHKDYILYTTNLITLNDTELNENSKIGIINDTNDIEGNVLAYKLIKKYNLEYELVEYNDYFDMIYDMYEGNIDGLFTSNNYATTFSSQERYENIKSEVKVLYDYSEEMENKETFITNKKLTEPFSMLIMGVDSELDGLNANQNFNGDTLILVTFNPKTLTATMFSIPRDMYVPITCRNNTYDKINSSTIGGSSCVINTVEQMTDIKIDYYLKINFQGVVDLIDELGGVTVNVEEPAFNTFNGQVCEQDSKRRKGSHLVCMDTGEQNLNGEQALAYARCRHLYLLSDIDRNRHQQDLIEAVTKKAKKIKNLDEVKGILDVVSNNIDTNLTNEQILSFYEVLKSMVFDKKDVSINIKKTFLEYYDLKVYLQQYNSYTSALGYYKSSMEAITRLMKVNLEEEKEERLKTFEYDSNKDYTPLPTGKGLKDNDTLELLPDFIGNTEGEVRAWCEKRGISVSTNIAYSYEPYGTVVDQGLSSGVLVKNVSHLTLYVSNGTGFSESNNNNNNNENILDGYGEIE